MAKNKVTSFLDKPVSNMKPTQVKQKSVPSPKLVERVVEKPKIMRNIDLN
jgi:hypothetical protein